MRFYVGVTDIGWFRYLSGISPEDVNFWQPGGSVAFKALAPGAPFLFKLKAPLNAIGGVGFFASHTFLPVNIAWSAFGPRNGADTFMRFRSTIAGYRKDHADNPTIGCVILTNPIFFSEQDWIEVPSDWHKNIVQGKTYDTATAAGRSLWSAVELRLQRYLLSDPAEAGKSQLLLEEPQSPAYGESVLTKVRLGQGAFRVLVTDAYKRRCAITGEKTLPVLEAAHIKPYSLSGPHFISNGMLMRSDVHRLFDNGYITVTPDLKVEVSRRIREEFENGREYYQYHGKTLIYLPERDMDVPGTAYVQWHNENVFRG